LTQGVLDSIKKDKKYEILIEIDRKDERYRVEKVIEENIRHKYLIGKDEPKVK
jgi:hypothetical protein